jgi:predicted transposase YdaD
MPPAQIPIHDSFFKCFMSRPQLAGTFLREHLPSPIAMLLSPEPPELLPGSFVDEVLAQHHSDLLFRLPLKADHDALAYVLLEHRTSRDPATRLQLLRYIVRILAKWYDEHEELPLPLVVPLVAHQGPGSWTLSTEFIDLFGSIPEPLRPYTVSFRHTLVDLPCVPDNELSADTRLGAYLRALKYGRRRDLPRQLELILVPELPDMDLAVILHYINDGPITVSPESLQAVLQRLDRSRRERIMGHFSREFEAQGEARGEARGRLQGELTGRVQGEAHALLRLLEKRFGTVVPAQIRERISTADLASIVAWFDRALEVNDLNSVFPSNEIG